MSKRFVARRYGRKETVDGRVWWEIVDKETEHMVAALISDGDKAVVMCRALNDGIKEAVR